MKAESTYMYEKIDNDRGSRYFELSRFLLFIYFINTTCGKKTVLNFKFDVYLSSKRTKRLLRCSSTLSSCNRNAYGFDSHWREYNFSIS